MKYIPLGSRLVIELQEKKTKSGIVLTNKELDEVATIISIGADVKELRKGDKIIYNKFAGFTLDNPMLRLIEDKDVLAKVEE